MKTILNIPIILIILIAISIPFNLFLGAYVVAEGATSRSPDQTTIGSGQDSGDGQWYESASIWICPFH